jgi:putative ABC transport system ATP-binding protein
MAHIEVKDLRKIYHEGSTHGTNTSKTVALDGVTFTIEKGEFVAIMGPSGSGKSTLLHILGFLDVPSSGIYKFEGRNALNYTTDESAFIRNNRMGFIFQAFNLLPKTSVLENVKLPLLYSSIPESEWDTRAKKAIEAVQLMHRVNHEPSELSGGEKQRVAIARALVNDPQVIFADEPTGNLDSKSGRAVMETIEKLNNEGHTIILITHETSTAEHAKRIINIKDGQIEKDVKVHNRKRATEEYTK